MPSARVAPSGRLFLLCWRPRPRSQWPVSPGREHGAFCCMLHALPLLTGVPTALLLDCFVKESLRDATESRSWPVQHMYGANKLLPLSLFHSLCVPEGKHDIASTITDSRAVLLKLLSKCRDGILTNGMGAAAQHARRPLHKMHL